MSRMLAMVDSGTATDSESSVRPRCNTLYPLSLGVETNSSPTGRHAPSTGATRCG